MLKSADLLFPNPCLNCGTRIGSGQRYLCQECYDNLPVVKKATCSYCGLYFENIDERISFRTCPVCSSEEYHFDRSRYVLEYDETVQALIHNFKYYNMTGVARLLSRLMISWLEEHRPFPVIDFITPVPLHSVRKRERGYNQSELLTKPIASYFGWTYKPKLLTRVRYTKSQTQLKGKERKENVIKAFSIDKIPTLKDSNILLIDDVFTTGATVNAISKELKNYQACKVYVLTAARALTS